MSTWPQHLDQWRDALDADDPELIAAGARIGRRRHTVGAEK